MAPWKALFYFLFAVGITAFTVLWLLPRLIAPDTYRRAFEIRTNPDARAAGRDLAVLCETARLHPEWFEDQRSPRAAWLPPAVLRYNPNYLYLNGDGATIAFGGGSNQFGYSLKPEIAGNDKGLPNTWIFRFFFEDSRDRELGRYTLSAKDALSEPEFVDRVFLEFERRLASVKKGSARGDWSISAERCGFALKRGQTPRLFDAIRATARNNPDVWCNTLLVFAIDFPRNPRGADGPQLKTISQPGSRPLTVLRR